ncbi:AIR synthase family protein [Halorarius litoreus]|uniref:AIR synthase family protein n=1 Tax=Halorarius litoreus TaxID=2962676 RepID=UPI0020CD1D76|nr:AIR synthase family protein [Halorarius litoreus]
MTGDAGESGKVDRTFFEEHVQPRLGAERDDVPLGPKHGVDFGVVDVNGTALVCACDPVFVLPDLGWERAAWFAFHILLSDVAVSGLPPTHLAVNLNLPPDMTDEEFATFWEVFDHEAHEFDVAFVTGHTARYPDGSFPTIGGGTAMAVGDHDDVVRPDGARPGDGVIVTKGPAVESTGLLATRFEDALADEPWLDDALNRFRDASPVKAALVAAAAGPVTAMHDATERGLLNAFHEMAGAADVGFDVTASDVPVLPGVIEACDFFDLDPWTASSEGTLVITCAADGTERVLDALADENIPAAEVGKVTKGDGVTIDGEATDPPTTDGLWPAMAAFAESIGEPGVSTR